MSNQVGVLKVVSVEDVENEQREKVGETVVFTAVQLQGMPVAEGGVTVKITDPELFGLYQPEDRYKLMLEA